jgi:hypothetical protein
MALLVAFTAIRLINTEITEKTEDRNPQLICAGADNREFKEIRGAFTRDGLLRRPPVERPIAALLVFPTDLPVKHQFK